MIRQTLPPSYPTRQTTAKCLLIGAFTENFQFFHASLANPETTPNPGILADHALAGNTGSNAPSLPRLPLGDAS